MEAHILQTKLHIPEGRSNLVSRPHLIDKLKQGLEENGGFARKFTLLSAPAGSGKTTLLIQFAASFRGPVAWLSLDEADDDPNRFWTYLIAACQSELDGIGESALALLKEPESSAGEAIATILINDFVGREQPLALVFEDYHVIQNPAIHESVSFMLEHLPDNLHVVVSTRADPPWPLARYRARNQLIEIRARDLRFSQEEAVEFFNQTMGLNLAVEEVATLETRTEGWAAGLQLAAIAMQSSPPGQNRAAFIRAFTGSHLYIAEYLIEEILQRLPESVQTFLLNTSILERLNGGLCDAVTGRADAQASLKALYRANLFVIPLDNEGCWFRFHHLFADLLHARLRQQVSAEELAALHLHAAAWYEHNGNEAEAIRHTLAAQDFERGASLVEREARAMMFSGRVHTLRKWLVDLPEASFQAHPSLGIYRLWIDLVQEKTYLSPQALQEKEALLRTLPPSPENERLQVELMAVLWRFMAFAGDTSRAIHLAEEALARLPEGELGLRARAHSALAVAHWMEGSAEKATQAYDHCMHLTRANGNASLAAHAKMMMAMSEIDYGQLHQAANTYQSIIDMGKQTGQKLFFPGGQGYVGLASIYLEWNDLVTADTHLQQGMTLCRQGGLGLTIGHTIKARLHQAQGEFQAAAAELERLGETGVNPTGTARQILFSIALGDLNEAARLAKPWLNFLGSESAPAYQPLLAWEIIQVTLARLFLAQGESEEAWQLLERVEETASPGRRNGRLVEIYLFKALVILKLNEVNPTAQARDLFTRALALAEPEGYMLLFLEAGTAILPLLQTVISHRGTPRPLQVHAQKLLLASRTYGKRVATLLPDEAAGLVEMLTPREMEVLALVAAGDSNQTIADKLFITVRTVKKHVTSILGKLGVKNRTQAAARARELGLIDSN